MIQLKNENGFLFSEEERLFMDFLMFKKRILLFKQAIRGNNDNFDATDSERNILKVIKEMQYVKSKHIQNILS